MSSNDFPWYLMMKHSLLRLHLLKIKTCGIILLCFHYQHSYWPCKQIQILVALFCQYPCSCYVIVAVYLCYFSSIMIQLPFILIPSVTARSSLKFHYSFISCGMLFLLVGHPFMTYTFGCCRCSSWSFAHYISCIDMHSGMSIAVCTTSMLIIMPGISDSVLVDSQQYAVKSLWLCLSWKLLQVACDLL